LPDDDRFFFGRESLITGQLEIFGERRPAPALHRFPGMIRCRRGGSIRFVALLLFLSLPRPGLAQPGPHTRQRVIHHLARGIGLPHYYDAGRSGARRIYLNASAQTQLDRLSAALGRGQDVLQVLALGPPRRGEHTLISFDGMLLDITQLKGKHWRLGSWGAKVRTTTNTLYSALIQLTATEATNLRQRIDAAFAEQGALHQAGLNWEHGHLQRAFGPRSFNCASVWAEMPIGGRGETLAAICGLDLPQDNTRRLVQDLEQHGNQRVFGIVLYGPRIDEFAADRPFPRIRFPK
jgi:hypothetical protein